MKDRQIRYGGEPAKRERPICLVVLQRGRRHQPSRLGSRGFHDRARVEQADGLEHEQQQQQKRWNQQGRLDSRLGAALCQHLNTGICRWLLPR